MIGRALCRRTSRWLPVGVAALLLATAVADAADDSPTTSAAPAVVLVIGDGMGPGIIDVASYEEHQLPGRMFVHTLEHRGMLTTAPPGQDFATDSAAAATAMATGAFTTNRSVGVDPSGNPLPNVIELARARGKASGIVTTAMIVHATPAAFVAHTSSRLRHNEIRDQYLEFGMPDVMLGGGLKYFSRAAKRRKVRSSRVIQQLQERGYAIALDREELAAAVAENTRVVGLFARGHLPYVEKREADSAVPSLPDMTRAALVALDRNPHGFLLIVESARIDMAGHSKYLDRMVAETLELDRTVRAIAGWAKDRGNVTLIVTADHDTGGIQLTFDLAGPVEATWASKEHTRIPVPIFAQGPGTAVFEGKQLDLRYVHAVIESRLSGQPFQAPPILPRAVDWTTP